MPRKRHLVAYFSVTTNYFFTYLLKFQDIFKWDIFGSISSKALNKHIILLLSVLQRNPLIFFIGLQGCLIRPGGILHMRIHKEVSECSLETDVQVHVQCQHILGVLFYYPLLSLLNDSTG